MDGYLARGLPPLLRAFLTAAFGMTIAIGFLLTLFKIMFSATVPPEIMNAALCAGFFLLLPMGLCSFLSNDTGRERHSSNRSAREQGCAVAGLCMGAGSLLSHGYSGLQRRAIEPADA